MLSGAVKRETLTGQTPVKLREATAALPASYALLVEIFGETNHEPTLYTLRGIQNQF